MYVEPHVCYACYVDVGMGRCVQLLCFPGAAGVRSDCVFKMGPMCKASAIKVHTFTNQNPLNSM